MKENHTDIIIVLDRSGSMQTVKHDTIGGFNSFLEDQKKAAGTADITLNQFDNIYEHVIGPIDIHRAKPLTNQTYEPRGSTALLDAIGRTIEEAGNRLKEMPESNRPTRVVMVIITDGYENASQKFTSNRISEMIAHQRDVYKWEFVFLGANQDAIATASSMNIPVSNAMSYAANTAGTKAAYDSISSNLMQVRSGDAVTMAFCDEDRDAQTDAGVEQY